MKKIKSLFTLTVSGLLLAGCGYNPPEPAQDPTNPGVPPVAGTADFSKYVAVGNSPYCGLYG